MRKSYLEVTREKMLHKRNRPLLERLGQDCVIGVAKSLLNDYMLSALCSLSSILQCLLFHASSQSKPSRSTKILWSSGIASVG
jgi:hypothetical protein